MLRKTKRIGRCPVRGHGTKCEVAEEIQAAEWTRTQDKRLWKSQVEVEVEELNKDKQL